MPCPHCGREDENNPSDYYHRKRCDQKAAYREVEAAIERGASSIEIYRLREKAIDAGDCGD